MDFTNNEEMKSIKDCFQNDANDVELEDDILRKRSKSDKESKIKLKGLKSDLQVRKWRV